MSSGKSIKRFLAGILSAALITGTPGPGPVSAFAQAVSGVKPVAVGPVSVGGAGASAAALGAGAGFGLNGASIGSGFGLQTLPAVLAGPMVSLPTAGSGAVGIDGIAAVGIRGIPPAAGIRPSAAGRAIRTAAGIAEPSRSGPEKTVAAQIKKTASAVSLFQERGDAGGARGSLDALYQGSFEEASASGAVEASPKPRGARGFRSKLKKFVPGLAVAAGALSVSVPVAAAKGAVSVSGASIVDWLQWSSPGTLIAAVILPFAVYLVPTLIKAFANRRSAAVARVARRAMAGTPQKDDDASNLLYVMGKRTRYQGGVEHVDRFMVRTPEKERGRKGGFSIRARVIVESDILRPAGEGKTLLTRVRYEYAMNGRAMSGTSERSVIPTEPGAKWKIDRYNYFDGETPLARSLLARWAPHESGTAHAFAVGLAAGLPAYLLASLPAHPLEPFLWTAAGFAVSTALQLWRHRGVPKDSEISDNALFTIILAAMAAAAGTFYFANFAAAAGLAFGLGAGFYAVSKFSHAKVLGPEPPSPYRKRVAGGFGAKVKMLLMAVAVWGISGMITNPPPVSAGEKEAIAARMEASGPVGAEYADYLRSKSGVPIYIVKPWHREDMSTALGRHYDAKPGLSPEKIMLDAEGYGINSREDIELALSTVLHELDHDKQEHETGGVPSFIQHEYSAWDHDTRFTLEQFETNPGLFAPGENGMRKYLMLKSVKRWLTDGPDGFKAYIRGLYEKNKDLYDFEHPAYDAYKEYYEKHDAEWSRAWEARKDDRALMDRLDAAISALEDAGVKDQDEVEVKLQDETILNFLLGGALSILSLLGLELLFPRLRSLREALRRRRFRGRMSS